MEKLKSINESTSTVSQFAGDILVRENFWVKTTLIWNELKKMEGQSLASDIHMLAQEVFFAEKHKTLEDISSQCLQVKYGRFNHFSFINEEKLKTEPCNFWAVVNGNQLYKFSEEDIKNIEASLPEFY